MAILPIDLQAMLVRMDSVSKAQQPQQEGIAIAQTLKAGELGDLAHIQSTRVNEIKPHPDGNSKIEDEQKKERKPDLRQRGKGKGKSSGRDAAQDFEEPFKGNLIDTKR